ncbi:efflux RND transporter periplasmic adaptor subunit [Thalassotalea euphylliae]|uniref:efflux RND transporter periplasmic adaptor subunit n=1 Tax=Thalassotalea euphylliae TaxID=1655234 RepID=UPI003639D206
MQMHRKAIASVFVMLFVVACGGETEVVTKEVVRPVRLLQIDLMHTKTHSFPARVESSKQANLSFRVPGKISKFSVRSGEDVKAGQLLAQLVPVDYEAIRDAQQASYNLAKVQHDRSEALIKDFLISREQFDSTNTELQVRYNELEQAKANLEYTQLFAPYDGVIAATYLKDFEYAQALQPVMSIQTENSIDIVINLPERLVNAMQRSKVRETPQRVTFPVDLEKKYTASLKEVETVADSETGAFRVVFTMPQPADLNLLPGMAATLYVDLVLGDKALIQKIPPAAILEENGQQFVWVYNDGGVEKRAVELDENLNLISGLEDGFRIVAAGANELTASTKVKPWVKERGL